MKIDQKKLKSMSSVIADISRYSTKPKKPILSRYYSKPTLSEEIKRISKYSIANRPKSEENIKVFKGKDGKDADPTVVASLIKEDVSREVVRKLMKNREFIDLVRGEKGDKGDMGATENSEPEKLAMKLNTLKEAIDVAVIRGLDLPQKNEGVDITDIVEKVIDSIKKSKRLDARDITGVSQKGSKGLNFNDQRWHGAGVTSITAGTNVTVTTGTDGGYIISATAAVPAILTTPSTIDDSNLDFTFTVKPSILIINGGTYQQTGGSITWTWDAGTLTATLSSAVGVNGSIFGM